MEVFGTKNEDIQNNGKRVEETIRSGSKRGGVDLDEIRSVLQTCEEVIANNIALGSRIKGLQEELRMAYIAVAKLAQGVDK